MDISDCQRAPTGPTGSFKVLVVDDHSATRKAILAVLDSAFPTCELHGVGSAEEALDYCSKQAQDIVLMDISLPGMNGIEATGQIKARHPRTHVVMHSSNDMQIFRDESTAAGAFAFISKRHTAHELVRVMALLMPSAA